MNSLTMPKFNVNKMAKIFLGVFAFLLVLMVTGNSMLAFLSGIIGMSPGTLINTIRYAYYLYRMGFSVREAISIATGGWGFVINLLAGWGISWLVGHLTNNWFIGW